MNGLPEFAIAVAVKQSRGEESAQSQVRHDLHATERRKRSHACGYPLHWPMSLGRGLAPTLRKRPGFCFLPLLWQDEAIWIQFISPR